MIENKFFRIISATLLVHGASLLIERGLHHALRVNNGNHWMVPISLQLVLGIIQDPLHPVDSGK